MKVMITGHNGYIGAVLTPMVQEAGHEVVGLDNYLFETCTFGEDIPDVPSLRKDIRDVEVDDLRGFDAVLHLAGLSNDPLGDLNPDCTYAINHRASVRLAKLALEATAWEPLLRRIEFRLTIGYDLWPVVEPALQQAGVTGIETRFYGEDLTVEKIQPNTPAAGKLRKGESTVKLIVIVSAAILTKTNLGIKD